MHRLLPVLWLGIWMSLSGCSDPSNPANAGGAEHHHVAPHGGRLIELGKHAFNIELVRDGQTGTLTAFLLDAHAENFVRIATPSLEVELTAQGQTITLPLTAVAQSQTGETVGDTSQFRGQAELLKGSGPVSGKVKVVELRGTRFQDVTFQL